MSAIYEIIALEGDCRLRVIYGDRSAGLSENPMQKVIGRKFTQKNNIRVRLCEAKPKITFLETSHFLRFGLTQ